MTDLRLGELTERTETAATAATAAAAATTVASIATNAGMARLSPPPHIQGGTTVDCSIPLSLIHI